MLLQRREVEGRTRNGLYDGNDPLAPPLIRYADNQGVVDRRMRLDRLLDLLGVDLLPAGVDALRAAAQHLHGAVALEHRLVTGQRPSLAVDLDERGGALLRVVVIPERHVPATGDAPDPTVAWGDFLMVSSEHRGVLVQREGCTALPCLGAKYAGLGRPHRVDEHPAR